MSSVPTDYDDDPARFDLVDHYGLAGASHETVATRLAVEHLEPVLDVGCGRGKLAARLGGHRRWVGLDTSPAQLSRCAFRPVVCGDATRLPFPDCVFGSVTMLWMLYHLSETIGAIREARRLLRPNGLFLACADSRVDAPELFHQRMPSSFDSEDAPEIVASVFGDVEVEHWEPSVIHLPDARAVQEFVRGM